MPLDEKQTLPNKPIYEVPLLAQFQKVPNPNILHIHYRKC